MQLYEYKPLPTASSIRILILHPATDATAPLEVDLVIRDRMELLRDPDNETFEPYHTYGESVRIHFRCTAEAKRHVFISLLSLMRC